MARITGTRTTSSVAPGGNELPRQVDNLLDIMSPDEVPFLKLIGIDGDESDNPKREWVRDELLAEKSTLASNIDNSTTSVPVAAGTGANFQVGNIIQIDSEQMWVSAVSTDTLTVTRGAFGTSAASHSSGADVLIVGISVAEGADTPQKGTTTIQFDFNYHQIFDTSFKISRRMRNTPQYGVENDYAHQLEKAFKELAIKLERQAILGQRAAASGNVPASFGGLDYFLDSASAGVRTDLSSAALEESHLLDALQTLWTNVGPANMADTILCGAWAKRKINSWYEPRQQMQRSETVGGIVIQKIETDFGSIGVKLLPRIPANKLYLVKLRYLKVHPYKGGRFAENALAVSGAYEIREVYGDYTMVVKNPVAMGVIKNFSLTS